MTEPLKKQPLYAYKGATFEDCIVLRNERDEIQFLEDGNVLVFGIRPHYSGECIIQRTWTVGDEADNAYFINLTPEETDIEPDEYKYDVSIQTADGDFYKVIPESPFVVLESTTKKQ